MIAAVLLGVSIGLCLGALGGGGSIITVPALVFLLHESLPVAVTQSLVIVGLSSAAAVAAHARNGQVRWRAGLALGAVGGAAAWVGTALGRFVPENVTMAAFAVLMVVVATSMLSRNRASAPDTSRALVAVGGPADTREPDPINPPRRPTLVAVKVVLAGAVIGVMTGFFGVGGGFVIVPALVMILGHPMPVAVGTSLLVVTVNSVAALTSRIGHDVLDWSVVLPVTIAAILGAIAGKHATQRFSERTLTTAFAVMVLAVASYVGIRTLF